MPWCPPLPPRPLPQRLGAGAQEVEPFLDAGNVRRDLRVHAFHPRAERRALVRSELDVPVLRLVLPDTHGVAIELLAPLEQLRVNRPAFLHDDLLDVGGQAIEPLLADGCDARDEVMVL